LHGDDDVNIDTEITMSVEEFIAYNAAFQGLIGTKTGRKYLYEVGRITSYAGKELTKLTVSTFVTEPAKRAIKSAAAKAAKKAVVRVAPPVATLVTGGIVFNAIGNTRANQQVGHIGYVGALGMGGTL
jgi:hypothetical protein